MNLFIRIPGFVPRMMFCIGISLYVSPIGELIDALTSYLELVKLFYCLAVFICFEEVSRMFCFSMHHRPVSFQFSCWIPY